MPLFSFSPSSFFFKNTTSSSSPNSSTPSESGSATPTSASPSTRSFPSNPSSKISLSSKLSVRRRNKERTERPAHHATTNPLTFRNPWPSAQPPSWMDVWKGEWEWPFSWYEAEVEVVGISTSSENKMRAKQAEMEAEAERQEEEVKKDAEWKAGREVRDVEVVKPDWGRGSVKRQDLKEEFEMGDVVVGTWLGHAGALVEIPVPGFVNGDDQERVGKGNKAEKVYCVFDPIFSNRAGPTEWVGPGRLRANPCGVVDLPGCNLILISHNHYDHLDLPTILSLHATFPSSIFLVPLGNAAWLHSCGIPKRLVFEMDWWDEKEFDATEFGLQRDGKGEGKAEAIIKVTCVPAQHNSGRKGADAGRTLWCGWVVEEFVTRPSSTPITETETEAEAPKKSTADSSTASAQAKIDTTSQKIRHTAIYHAGDTGYRSFAPAPAATSTSTSATSSTPPAAKEVTCPAFREIGSKLGPFDISFVPIWRGGSLGFFSAWGVRLQMGGWGGVGHVGPREALEVGADVNCLELDFGSAARNEDGNSDGEGEEGEGEKDMEMKGKGKGKENRKGGKNIIGVHFGTFVGSGRESLEAVREFDAVRREGGLGRLEGKDDESGRGRAGVLDLGGSLAVRCGG